MTFFENRKEKEMVEYNEIKLNVLKKKKEEKYIAWHNSRKSEFILNSELLFSYQLCYRNSVLTTFVNEFITYDNHVGSDYNFKY